MFWWSMKQLHFMKDFTNESDIFFLFLDMYSEDCYKKNSDIF